MGITLFWIPSLASQFTHAFLQRVFIECLLYARGPAVPGPSQAWLCRLQQVLKLEDPRSSNSPGKSGVQFWREVWGLGAPWWQDRGKVVKAPGTCSPKGSYAYVPTSLICTCLPQERLSPPTDLTPAPTYGSIPPTISPRLSPLLPSGVGLYLGMRVSGLLSHRAPNPESSVRAEERCSFLGGASTESPGRRDGLWPCDQ